MSKTVQVLGHQFDGCPAHLTVAGKGFGYTLRVATQRAIENMFRDPRLKKKRIDSFKLSVVVIAEGINPRKGAPPFAIDESVVPRPSAAADDALGTPQSVIDARPKSGA